MKKFFKKYTTIIILSILVIVFASLYFTRIVPLILQNNQNTQGVEKVVNSDLQVKENKISPQIKNIETKNTTSEKENIEISDQYITLIAGDINTKMAFTEGQNLHEILENSGVEFTGKEYPALGFFVENIGSLHEESGKYLFYYINGVEATVGVSNYVPEDRDVVTWELK